MNEKKITHFCVFNRNKKKKEKFIHDLWALPCRLDEKFLCSILPMSATIVVVIVCVYCSQWGHCNYVQYSSVTLDAMGGNSLKIERIFFIS
jgi:hypothetical protein